VKGAVSLNVSSPNRVPEACAGKVIPHKIAIVPDTSFTREYFMQTMALWYPRVTLWNDWQVPSFEESVIFFNSTHDLEAYVESDAYGDTSGLDTPRIYGAIVFDEYPDDDEIGSFGSIEYTLRLNSTLSNRGAVGRVARTGGNPSPVYPFRRSIDTGEYVRYAVTGFMTMQTLVTRFVTCQPDWNAATKTTTGACQHSQATAKSSPDLDARLLSTLQNDALINAALATLPSTRADDMGFSNPEIALSRRRGLQSVAINLPLANVLDLVSNETREALLKPLRQAPQPYLGASVAPFPIHGYTSSPFYDDVKNVFAIVFILAYLYAISRILVVFIYEKESRMREFMKILGINEKAIFISW
jgi:ATP-binding cassette subfamily A (ABC1) protein 1